MYLKLGDRYGTTGEGGFEEYDGGWNATAGRVGAGARRVVRLELGRFAQPLAITESFPHSGGVWKGGRVA